MNTSLLRGIQLPNPKCMKIELDDSLKNLKHYKNLETYIPTFKTLYNSYEKNITFENPYVIKKIVIENDENIKGNCKINVLENSNSYIVNNYKHK
jgi:hypothetical protein